MSKIICLKLTTGEELIGMEQHGAPGHYKDLANIIPIPSRETGKAGLALAPFLPYSDDESFYIPDSAIMIRHTPNTDMMNYYSSIFGSGIQVVKTL